MLKRTLCLMTLLIFCSNCISNSYTTSSGRKFKPKASYPKWSWDTVQEYKMFADGNRLLTDEEIKKIAGMSNFVCIEKQHGKNLLGGAELGAKHEARRLKAVNPDIKVLFYFNGAIPYSFTTYTKTFSPKNNEMSEKK